MMFYNLTSLLEAHLSDWEILCGKKRLLVSLLGSLVFNLFSDTRTLLHHCSIIQSCSYLLHDLTEL